MSSSADSPPTPFELLDRSALFGLFRDLMQRVYRPSLDQAVQTYGLIVVGGQALTLWAGQYLLDELTGEEVGFVTSDDLDFIGNRLSIDYCEQALNLTFRRATLDDNTPNLAVAELLWDGDQRIVIDILESIAGVTKKEIQSGLEAVELDGVMVALIDPVTCLKSRLYNLFAPWTADRQREAIRVRLAARASNYYLRELLITQGEGFAAVRGQFRMIRDMALSTLGKRAYIEHGIDLLAALPIDEGILPPPFITHEWPRLQRQVMDIRERQLAEHQRQGRPVHVSHLQPIAVIVDPR